MLSRQSKATAFLLAAAAVSFTAQAADGEFGGQCAMGLALGLLFGLVIFIATNWLVIMGHITSSDNSEVGPHLKLLGEFFIGYRVSFFGSFVGFVYGFVLGTLGGSLIAWIYNKFVDFRN